MNPNKLTPGHNLTLGGQTIGNNVAAVARDSPDNALFAGKQAKLIKHLKI
ncbi:hypothetical protein ACIRN9_06780 [Bacillus velezensis]|nr:hypothetical protein [Bacillus velezensis]UOF66566.1 hypothetical protein MTX90_10685 [Bacillus velezensis]